MLNKNISSCGDQRDNLAEHRDRAGSARASHWSLRTRSKHRLRGRSLCTHISAAVPRWEACVFRYGILLQLKNTQKLKVITIGRGGRLGLCALARLGILSMATRSCNGGNDFAFFACCALPPSDDRFSADDAWINGVGTLKGIAEVLL